MPFEAQVLIEALVLVENICFLAARRGLSLDKCGGKSKVSSQKRFSWMGSGKGTRKGEAQELAGFSRPTWLGTCHGLSCDSSVW